MREDQAAALKLLFRHFQKQDRRLAAASLLSVVLRYNYAAIANACSFAFTSPRPVNDDE